MPARAADAVSEQTAAVVAVHLYGRPAPVDELLDARAAARRGRRAGARARDRRPAGGIDRRRRLLLLLPDEEPRGLRRRRRGRDLGPGARRGGPRASRRTASDPRYFARRRGTNSRLDELQAALLRVRLRRLEDGQPPPGRDRRRLRRGAGTARARTASTTSTSCAPSGATSFAPSSRTPASRRPSTIRGRSASSRPSQTRAAETTSSVSTAAAREVLSLPCYAAPDRGGAGAASSPRSNREGTGRTPSR